MSLNYPKMKKIFFLLDKASLCRNYKLLNSICRFSTTPTIRYEGVRESRLKQRNLEETNSDYVSYEIIGNGSIDGLKSVLLSTPRQSYLFNCGECTQRKIQGRRTQGIIATASSISNVFITKPTWNNIGGLFGLCITSKSQGSPYLTIHGPENTFGMYEKSKSFLGQHLNSFDKEFTVHSHKISDGVFENNEMIARHISLNSSKINVKSPKPRYWKTNIDFTDAKIEQTVNAYVVSIKPNNKNHAINIDKKPMKICLQKCRALGVRPGGLEMKMLQSGESIVTRDGRKVTPEDVQKISNTSPDIVEEKPLTYLFVDIPSVDYLPNLLNDTYLQSNHEDLANIQGIFHFSPLSVVQDSKYALWMNSFSHKNVENIMLNENSPAIATSYDFLKNQSVNSRLNKIAPEIFREIIIEENEDYYLSDNENAYDKIQVPMIQPSNHTRRIIRPSTYNANFDSLDISNEDSDDEDNDEMKSAIHEVQCDINKFLDNNSNYESMEEYPKLHFLGTGSAQPHIHRNVSGILVETQPDNFILLDCGEGTLAQLFLHFGRSKALLILKKLKAIYISHMHADHHLGILGILIQREKYFREMLSEEPTKLYIIAPHPIRFHLEWYHFNIESCLTNLKHVKPNFRKQEIKIEELTSDLNLKSISTCRAIHDTTAFSLALVTEMNNFKLVYSGDTMPNDDLVMLGQNADILIHEATLEHRLLEDCKSKKHSTFTQAIQISQKMSAKQTIFTHFSQRYNKIPPLEEFEVEAAQKCCIAFDHMVVTPKTLGTVRLTYPALKILFQEELFEMSKKRRRKIWF